MTSRLDATKYTIKQLIKQNDLPQSFGLVVFSQIANYYIPPTDDTLTVLHYLDPLSSNHLPFGGTNIVQALELLMQENDPGRTIVLFSDM